MSEEEYQRRKGLEWCTTEYNKLILCLIKEKLTNHDKLNTISVDMKMDIIKTVYSKWGNRLLYLKSLDKFLKAYADTITADCEAVQNGETIAAPKLNKWLTYRNKLVAVMSKSLFRDDTEKFINDKDYSLSIKTRKKILSVMFGESDAKSLKRLNNVLHDNRKEICNFIIQSIGKPSSDQQKETLQYVVVNKEYLRDDTKKFTNADDIATAIIIDIYCLKTRTHKINGNILENLIENINFESGVTESIKDFELPMNIIISNLLLLIKKYFLNVKISETLLKWQLRSYLKLVEPSSGFTVKVCDRYSRNVNQGVKICTNKFLPRAKILNVLKGKILSLTNNEIQYLTENKLDFSVMAGNSNVSKLWLGPAAYVNHECQPNTKLYSLKSNDVLCLQTIRDISADEEITWNYGSSYFAPGECECSTCKINPDENVSHQQDSKTLDLKEATVVIKRLSDVSIVNVSNYSNDSSAPRGSLNLTPNTINEILGFS